VIPVNEVAESVDERFISIAEAAVALSESQAEVAQALSRLVALQTVLPDELPAGPLRGPLLDTLELISSNLRRALL
jgi:hypothetical protein